MIWPRSALAVRRLVPEVLDHLDEADPRAIGSRRDLVRINVLMANVGVMAGLLRTAPVRAPCRLLDLGAGDGGFALALARRLAPQWPEVEVVLLDRKDLVTAGRRAAIERLGWRTTVLVEEVSAWTAAASAERYDAIVTNLFLHHFDTAALRRLLAVLAVRSTAVFATEPWRGAVPLVAARLLWAIGANDVTRHDAPASVRAGFRSGELSALWPAGPAWRITERRAGLFTHAFGAIAEPEAGRP